MSEANGQGSDDGSVIPIEGRRRGASARREITESEEYPTFQAVLLKYFPQNLANGKQTPNRQAEFLERYETYGEDTAEFDGLAAELRRGIRHPKSITPMVNEALGIDMGAQEMRDLLVSLLDQITHRGEFSEEDEVTKATDKGERPSPDALLDYWLRRRVSLPGGLLQGRSAPIWQVWLTGVLSATVGLIIMNTFSPTGWAAWLPRALLAAGIVVIAASSIAMAGLRSELLEPEREKKREEAKALARENREKRKESRRRLRNLIKP